MPSIAVALSALRTIQRNGNNMLRGFCLYNNDGQLVPPQTGYPVPPQNAQPYVPPQYVPPQYVPPQTGYPVPPQYAVPPSDGSDGQINGQCCPQANPVNINITNSQDTNSRNSNSSQKFVRQKPSGQKTLVRRRRDRIVRIPVPVIQRVIQQVPVPVIQTAVKEVPKEVIKQVEVPVIKNHYTERVIEVPQYPCNDKNYDYPEFY